MTLKDAYEAQQLREANAVLQEEIERLKRICRNAETDKAADVRKLKEHLDCVLCENKKLLAEKSAREANHGVRRGLGKVQQALERTARTEKSR